MDILSKYNQEEIKASPKIQNIRKQEFSITEFVKKISGGLIKTNKQADMALIILISVFILSAVIIYYVSSFGPINNFPSKSVIEKSLTLPQPPK